MGDASSMTESGLWRNERFLRLWGAQTISWLGSQVTLLAVPIIAVVTLDASPLAIGVLAAATTLPAPLFGLLAGVWTDRLRRRPILIGTDLGRAVALAMIPLALWLDVLSIPFLCVVSFTAGLLSVWFNVAHPSLLPSLVRRDQLVEANSKLEMSQSGAMIAGPGLAGLLIQVLTAPVAIIVDAVSYIVSAALLLRMEPEAAPARSGDRRHVWAEAREGIAVVRENRILATMALSLSVYNLFSSMVNALLILFAVRELGIDAAGLGVIFALGSAGFPIGAAAASSVARRFGVGRAIVWGAVVADLAVLLVPLAGLVPSAALPLLVASRVIATLTGPVTAINQLSLRQRLTPDHLLGRVNATMIVLSRALTPAGGVLAGALAEIMGLQATVLLAAIGVQAGFVILLRSPIRTLDEAAIAPAAG